MDFPELESESQRIWNENAEWWDNRMGEGDKWHSELIRPAVERLLAIQPGERVIDLACGNGHLSRRLARAGAQVIACDFSPDLLDRARKRGAHGIDYRLLDLANPRQLETLGEAECSAAVCNMALMDIASIGPMLQAVARALLPGGRFVFSILHPCFQSPGMRLTAERDMNSGHIIYAIKVSHYLGAAYELGITAPGQPVQHHYFHRPLSTLLGACFSAGFVLDGLEEPALEPSVPSLSPLSWDRYREIAPILVARLRTAP